MLALAAVLTSMHLEGPVPETDGDYLDVTFDVPAGTKEIEIHHEDMSTDVILDFGVWSPSGFRGWGGGNSENIIIGIDQSSRSYLPGTIEAGTWHLIVGKARLVASGNMYYADVTCRDDITLTPRTKAAYTPVILKTERRWYKGDFHVHSTESGDAQATFDQIHALATSRGLEFVNLSDHNTVSQHALIAAIQPMMPDLLITRGAEITTYEGHGNAVGISSYVDHRIGFQGRTTVDMIGDVQAQGGIFIVNHPALDLGTVCIGCAWNHPDTPWDKVSGIEIITGNFEIGVRGFTPRAIALWETQLAAGNRIAAIGGSDDHSAGMAMGANDSPIGSPTTLVLADALSETAIIDAVKHGRTMVKLRAPDDPDVDVHMKASGGTLAEIGDDVDGAAAQIPVHVTGGHDTFLELYRDGVKISRTDVTSDDFTVTLNDAPEAGDYRYRVELLNDLNERILVTSHFYFHATPSSGACGCNSASAGLGALLAVFGVRRRRTRRG